MSKPNTFIKPMTRYRAVNHGMWGGTISAPFNPNPAHPLLAQTGAGVYKAARLMALALLLLAVSPIASAQPLAAQDAQYERGKKLFGSYCARCHGKDADGEGRMVIRLYRRMQTQLPSNFTLSTYTDRPSEYMRKIITEGGENNAMSKYMPPFGQELSTKNIDDLIYFIHLIPQRTRDAKSAQ